MSRADEAEARALAALRTLRESERRATEDALRDASSHHVAAGLAVDQAVAALETSRHEAAERHAQALANARTGQDFSALTAMARAARDDEARHVERVAETRRELEAAGARLDAARRAFADARIAERAVSERIAALAQARARRAEARAEDEADEGSAQRVHRQRRNLDAGDPTP